MKVNRGDTAESVGFVPVAIKLTSILSVDRLEASELASLDSSHVLMNQILRRVSGRGEEN